MRAQVMAAAVAAARKPLTCVSVLSRPPITLCTCPASELLRAPWPPGALSPALLAPWAWGKGIASLGKARAGRERSGQWETLTLILSR